MAAVKLLLALSVSCLFFLSLALKDPYKVLGVSQSASIPEIKRAYKRLAREYHPDKNKDSEAESKFIEVNKAYELLMDPERRLLFDRFGKTEDTPNFRQQPDYTKFKRFDFDPFESMFSQGGYNFHFKFNQGSLYHKYTVTAKAYENHILPNSNFQPYLIMFYGELCFPCLHAEPVWQKLAQELEPLGLSLAAIHGQQESALAHKIGVSSVPYLIGVIDGRAVHYRESQLSFIKVVDFIRRMVPTRTIQTLTDSTAVEFLQGWHDNRVRALIFSRAESIRLRYLLLAYRFHMRVAFGHVRLGVSETEQLKRRYNVHSQMESLLVFNEDYSRPVATVSMSELSTQVMRDVIESNKFLMLPRLSSQVLFDQLCPPEVVRTKKFLCVILVTKNDKQFEPSRAVMRDFIRYSELPSSRVRFMFLFEEKQQEFIKALCQGRDAPKEPLLHVVVLWRKEHDRVKYQWLSRKWSIEDDINATKDELKLVMQQFMENTDTLQYDAKVALLTDEHALSLFTRILNRLTLMGDILWDNITRQEILPVVSVIMSIGFIVLVGYVMSYLVQLEERSIQEKYSKEGKQVPGVNTKAKPEYRLHIHELRGETYNGLVRLLKPGCRTIVLLVDTESKMKLLPMFYRIVYPYRKNKTLMFAFLMVEKNLEWYRRLLLQTLGERRELNINPRNCIGTVLSLNGHRKYFCVYHAKHAELNVKGKLKKANQNVTTTSGGEFMGFEESNSESENSDLECGNFSKNDEDSLYDSILFQEHLLDGLPNWLDRLFEGSTQRYYIQYWPDNMK